MTGETTASRPDLVVDIADRADLSAVKELLAAKGLPTSDVSEHFHSFPAEASFASGLYCAESFVLALAKAQDIESDLLLKVATAFCSGMARTRGTCGALTGAIMGVSLALGRSKASEPVYPSYMATQRLVREFEQEFGARDCNVLLGCDLNTPEGQATFRESRFDDRCAKYTGKAAEIAARILSSKPMARNEGAAARRGQAWPGYTC
ncbi:MAG: C-GCAxxG-C-C family protein [Actinobacteria bacterium]|nr:C-GCAxxG-C-C family protein [Actinomycetota bacterium]